MINDQGTTEARPHDSGWGVLGGLLVLAVCIAIVYALLNPGATIVPAWHAVADVVVAAWHGLARMLP